LGCDVRPAARGFVGTRGQNLERADLTDWRPGWEAATVSPAPDVPTVDPAEAHASLGSGVTLLDVRESDEWDQGHAPDATWIPLGELAARAGELRSDQPVVVVCRSGGRSARATAALLQAGYDATNLAGGMQAWAAAGFPVVTGGGAPGAVA
jgi:rhodanese-related sulfurtransferase